MKKLFKRFKRQILALVMVFMVAVATCISVSALNLSHIDSLSVGESSLLASSDVVVSEDISDGMYLLNVSPSSSTPITGDFECIIIDFYVHSSSDSNGITFTFNGGSHIGDTFVTVRYSEGIDSAILTKTFEFYSPMGSHSDILYTDFGPDSFYIHSITITSSVTSFDVGLTSFELTLDDVIVSESMTPSVLDSILDVFSNVGIWIAQSVQNLIVMFYANGSLTFLGVLAVAGLAISVIFLMLSVIGNFLRFRG